MSASRSSLADDQRDVRRVLGPGTAPPGRPSCRRPRSRPGRRRRRAPRSGSRRSRRSSLRTRSSRGTGSFRYRRARGDRAPCGPRPRCRRRARTTWWPSSLLAARRPRPGTVMRAPNFSAWIDGPLGQLGAGDAGREAEVVLDPRRTCRPGRRSRRASSTTVPSPPTRRRRPPPGRPARRRRRRGRRRRVGGRARRRPIAPRQLGVARVAQHLLARQITTGVSSGRDAELRAAAPRPGGRSSRSIQRCGRRLRAANSRSRRASGE